MTAKNTPEVTKPGDHPQDRLHPGVHLTATPTTGAIVSNITNSLEGTAEKNATHGRPLGSAARGWV